MHRILTDSVKILLKHVAEATPESYPILLTLIKERRDLINRELRLERMVQTDMLPPLIKNIYNLDYLFEEYDVVRIYDRLLHELYTAELFILVKMEDLNIEAPASDL